MWCWRSLLRVPWTERRSNQSILKGICPEYSLEGLMLKLILWPILWPSDVKKWFIWRDWCWERLKAGGKGDNRGWDGWVASPTQWTLVWASSRSWWWTGKPGMLQSMCAKIRKGLSNWTETAKHPTIWRPVPSDSLEHRVPLSTLNSLRGCWRSIATTAQGSISVEADGKCSCCSVTGNALGKCQFVVCSINWSEYKLGISDHG